MIVVNLFGAPGSGKSTGASYIFSKLKMLGINCELVTEYAKDKVWEENTEVFKNQAYIFGKQSYRISRCDGKVDVIITDSPLPLSIYYNDDPKLTQNFNNTVMDVFNYYNNCCYLLERVKPYNPAGRHQTQEESDVIGDELFDFLEQYEIPFSVYEGNQNGYDAIIKDVVKSLQSVYLYNGLEV